MDLKKFDNITATPWKDVWASGIRGANEPAIYIEFRDGETDAKPVDYELMVIAPRLLERVKQLESFIDFIFVECKDAQQRAMSISSRKLAGMCEDELSREW